METTTTEMNRLNQINAFIAEETFCVGYFAKRVESIRAAGCPRHMAEDLMIAEDCLSRARRDLARLEQEYATMVRATLRHLRVS